MDLSALKALPLGLLMFGAMAWGFFRRRTRQHQAQAEYPALASELGLTYRPPSHPKQIGRLHGTVRGFSVFVDPDEERKLAVRFHGEPALDLRSYEGPRCPVGMGYYSARDRGVDTYLKTRYASPDMALRLDTANLAALLRPFSRTLPARRQATERHGSRSHLRRRFRQPAPYPRRGSAGTPTGVGRLGRGRRASRMMATGMG